MFFLEKLINMPFVLIVFLELLQGLLLLVDLNPVLRVLFALEVRPFGGNYMPILSFEYFNSQQDIEGIVNAPPNVAHFSFSVPEC